ncbi:MAG: transglutaminase-like domain-containing protein [Gemmatimonadota bacterium]|nr:transglutaminase-like domain-containing protein [Gemmatimonadota bacterium]MDH5804008.1 transglutaminase-like domain-containing protein [Gemmatimonadota bacterium]
MNRRTAALAIVGIWIGAMAWLWLRETGSNTASDLLLAEAERTVEPGAMYYAVSMGGISMGYASNTVDTVPEGLRVEDRLFIEVPAMGEVQRAETRTVAMLSNNLRLRTFDASMASQAGQFTATGIVAGDTLLSVSLTTENGEETMEVPLEEPLVLPIFLPLRLALGGNLEAGATYSVRVFDPLMMQHRSIDIDVIRDSVLLVPDSAALDPESGMWVAARWDTVPAWHIQQTVNGTPVDSWIDGLGRTVSATFPMGFSIRRTAFEIAFHNFRNRDREAQEDLLGSDLIHQTAIASNVSVGENVARLKVVLNGVTPEGFDLDGGRQTFANDTLEVVREDLESFDLPYRLPNADSTLARYIRPEPLIQSEDPRIQAQARLIINRTRHPVRAARAISEWVYEELEKRVTISVPSAVDILTSRHGDCNEHTLLYVALARAVGLPARTAAGLVYVNGRFYYHAWPEVFLGTWVAVDPTFGQFPADASHLRFTIGGLARQTELIRLVGRLGLEVVEIEEQI